MKNIRIRQIDIWIYAMYMVMFKIYAMPQLLQQVYKVMLLGGVLIYLFLHMDLRRFLNGSLLFSGFAVVSTILGYMSDCIPLSDLFNGIQFALCLFALYTLFLHCKDLGYTRQAVGCLWQITGVFCVISLLSILIQGTSPDGTTITYFFGNKFATSYFFLMFAGLSQVRYHDHIQQNLLYRFGAVALALIAIAISGWIYCSTSMVAGMVLAVAPLLPKSLRRFAMHPVTVVVVMLLCAVFPLLMEPIMSSKLVQYVVVNVLGESLSLTGRKKIYRYLLDVIAARFAFGYGYGNDAVWQVVGFGNAQNGLMQYMVDYGACGTVFFLGTVYGCVKKAKNIDWVWGAFALLYAMIVASLVEISYGYLFFMALFLLCWADASPASPSKT